MASLTKCSICGESVTDPLTLPCLHSSCSMCLLIHDDYYTRNDKFCFSCNRSFNIPDREVKRNRFVQSLVDIGKLTDTELFESCETCAKYNELSSVRATHCCIDCKEKLCERCSKPHRQWGDGTIHNVLELDNVARQELIKQQANYCEQHLEQRLKLFCEICRESLCVTCFVDGHRTHSCVDVNSAAEKLAEQLRAEIRNIELETGKLSEKLQRFCIEEKIFNNDVTAIDRLINQKCNELKKQVDRKVSEEIRKIKEKGDAAKILIDEEMGELKEQLQFLEMEEDLKAYQEQLRLSELQESLQTFVLYCTELIDKGAACDIANNAHRLNQRYEELCQSCRNVKEYRFSGLRLNEVKRPDIVHVMKTGTASSRMIGDIGSAPGETSVADPLGPLLLCRHTKSRVASVTVLEDTMYVVCENSSKILSFNDHRAERIRVNGMKNPTGIVACDELHKLYVLDIGKCCVWKVWADEEKTANKFLQLILPNINFKFSCSMTRCRLLLSWCDLIFVICAKTGTGLEMIVLQEIANRPLVITQALETQTGTYICCTHAESDEDDIDITEVDKNGEIIRSYNTDKNQVSMKGVIRLTSDEDNRVYYVAETDDSSGCVLQLNSELEPRGVFARIASENVIPHGLKSVSYLPASHRLLFVGSNCVKLFGVRCRLP